MRWGEVLLDENNKERMEMKKTVDWLQVNEHKATCTPASHSQVLRSGHQNTPSAPLNDSAMMTFTTSPRALKADFPLAFLPPCVQLYQRGKCLTPALIKA